MKTGKGPKILRQQSFETFKNLHFNLKLCHFCLVKFHQVPQRGTNARNITPWNWFTLKETIMILKVTIHKNVAKFHLGVPIVDLTSLA